MSTLEQAIAIAARAHAGQTDKVGEPYILHPIRVMLQLDDPEERMVAMLHDVVEKTSTTSEDLRAAGFSPAVIGAVELLTHDDAEDYFEAVRRTLDDPHARAVKVADLRDNLRQVRSLEETPQNRERAAKYERALRVLGAEDGS